MSKLSQLHLTLDEQAVELGFEGLGEALMKGYDVDYEEGKLVRRGLGYSETVEHLAKEQEKAHEAWLKERDKVLSIIESVKEDIINLNGGNNNHVAIDELDYVIDFIEKGEV